ncbi:MAG: type II secretion system F family protein [Acidobacteriales bacterium]|nr:type II secretion system F family protein [Terriglobales bacterium]
MPLLMTLTLFVLLVLVAALAGMKLWAQPKAAIERVTGATISPPEQMPSHPSLAFHEVLSKIGSILPASPKDVTVMQRRLIRAGIRTPNALKLLYGSKVFLGLVMPLMMALALSGSDADPSNKGMAIFAAAAAGFFGPNQYVNRRVRRRQKKLSRGLPNALDLLVVCVESGLGLDQAMVQVCKELEAGHPEISEEFAMVTLELKAGKRRVEALRNLAERTGVEDLKKLVAVLIQADRFGTGISQSLRAHSDFMRVQIRQQAEEKAAKLGVKLVFPIFFCILPSLFVVTVGPVVMRIIRELIPMMNNM